MGKNENPIATPATQPQDETEKLIWAFLDNRADVSEARHLEEQIQQDDVIRDRYLELAQVHAHLYEQCSMQTQSRAEKSPVLTSLFESACTAMPSSVFGE